MINLVGTHLLPTALGEFSLSCFSFGVGNQHVFALRANTNDPFAAIRLRIQFGCLYGTTFLATNCDCNDQWNTAMELASRDHSVLLLYYSDHEARGLGIETKVRLSSRQTSGEPLLGLIESEEGILQHLDVAWAAAGILNYFGCYGNEIVAMTRSGTKVDGLRTHGLNVVSVDRNWDRRD